MGESCFKLPENGGIAVGVCVACRQALFQPFAHAHGNFKLLLQEVGLGVCFFQGGGKLCFASCDGAS